MRNHETRFGNEIRAQLNKMDEFMKESNFTDRSLLSIEFVTGTYNVDPSRAKEYINCGIELGKKVR